MATGAASRLRLKRTNTVLIKKSATRGNWGGFSFEIETLPMISSANPQGPGGNWGGFSFEIETPGASCNHWSHLCGNWGGFSFEIETANSISGGSLLYRGNWGGFSFEIETMITPAEAALSPAAWQLGRLLV